MSSGPGPMPGQQEEPFKSHNQPYKRDGGQFNNFASHHFEEIQGISGGQGENIAADFEENKLEQNFN